MTKTQRPKPVLVPQLCKGCGRCIESCPSGCISLGDEVNPLSGLTPVIIDFDRCNGCGLCISACPEPYGLTATGYELDDPAALFGERDATPAAGPADVPETRFPLPASDPLVLKGNHAAALGALLAGCRHVFGYPITPSTEGAELMAKLLPEMRGVFLQAVSEVATVNHMYGCGGAGIPCMTFTSSPGLSLMLEGISYMIGAEVPAVFATVSRGGPGLGNIGPEQADIKLLCRGLGHGNTHAIVLTPSTPQEMLDLTMEAFRLAFTYRNPVFVLADGYLGQMTGRVEIPDYMVKPGLPPWAVYGDAKHKENLICSIFLAEPDLEAHNVHINEKYDEIRRNEQRSTTFHTDDARTLVIACNTPARMSRGVVKHLHDEGLPVGLLQPITLWPFPSDALRPLLDHVTDIVVVEAGAGQLAAEVRLAIAEMDRKPPTIHTVQRFGGVLPSETEIETKLRAVTPGAQPVEV